MKTTRILLFISLILLVYSYQKEDISSHPETGSGGDVVFNLNKTTMLQLVNDVRHTGCTCGTTAMPPVAPVTWNDQLAKAAYDHALDMNQNNYFSHTGLNGSTAGQRITAAGYQWRSYGENLAKGYTSEQAVMTAFFDDGAFAHDDDSIRRFDGRKTMGNEDAG